EPRDVDAAALGRVDDQLALGRDHLVAVDRERDRVGVRAHVTHAGATSRRVYALPLSFVVNSTGPPTYASNSERKRPTPDAIGETAEGPSGQLVVCRGGHATPGLMLSHTSSSIATSLGRPRPAMMRDRIFSSQAVPSRHGVHLPHDSRAKKRTTRWQALTMS